MDELTLSKVKSFSKWVMDTANQGVALVDQALVGSTAAFVVLALLVFNFFWVLAAMFGAMLGYRILQHVLKRREFNSLSEREQFDWAIEEKRKIWADERLPLEEKQKLSGFIDGKLGVIDTTVKYPELTSGTSAAIEKSTNRKSLSSQPQHSIEPDSKRE